MKKFFAVILICIASVAGAAGVITPHFSDIITKGPWVDVRASFNGQPGAVPTLTDSATMSANAVAIKAAIDNAAGRWIDLAGEVYHTNAVIMAQNKYSNPLRIRNGRVYGHNIAGPVIDAGGSTVAFDHVQVYVDNCQSAIWLYRTSVNPGGGCRFYDSSFSGTATSVMIYSIGSEGNDFYSTHLQQQSNAPGYVSASTNRLNLGFTDCHSEYVYGGAGGSNAVMKWDGGEAWADYANSTANAVFRIYEGNHFGLVNVSGANQGVTPFLEIGNTDGKSLDSVSMKNCRSETNGIFVKVRGNVKQLEMTGNTPNSQTIVSADNNYSVDYATISGNGDLWNGNYGTYTFWNLRYSHFDQPQGNLVVNNGILGVTGKAQTVTLNGLGANQYSPLYEQAIGGTMQKLLDFYKSVTAEPTYSAIPGVFALPDGTSWNPAGLKNKPAMNLLKSNGAGAWYQFPVIRSTTPPATATTACTIGEMSFDNNSIYMCISDNVWRKSSAVGW